MNEKELTNEFLRIESVLRHRLKNIRANPKRENDKELIAFENGIWFAYNLMKPVINRIVKGRKEEEKKYQAKVTAYGQAYNIHCFHYQESDGVPSCERKMDMCFCGKNCAFATTNQTIRIRR